MLAKHSIMLIQTERTTIKFPSLTDVDNLYILTSDEDIARQNFNTRGKISMESVERLLKQIIQENSKEDELYFFAGIYKKEKQHELIGFVTNKEAGYADYMFLGGFDYALSYALRSDFRNKGIMTEVLLAVTSFMQAKSINMVAALVKLGNIQSEKALRKADFDMVMFSPGGTAFVKKLNMSLKKYAAIFRKKGLPENEIELNLLNRAIILINNEDYFKVIELLENLLKQNDNIIDVYTYLAFSNFKTDNLQKAKYYFGKAIFINKYDFNMYYHRGMMHDQLGEYDMALSDYSMGIELFDQVFNDPLKDMYFNRAIIYIDEGNIDNAILDIKTLEKLGDPEVDKLYRRLRNPLRRPFGF